MIVTLFNMIFIIVQRLIINNIIGDEGGKALVEALEINKSLTIIGIKSPGRHPFEECNSNNIKDKILKNVHDLTSRNEIIYKITKNPSATVLDLKCNSNYHIYII